VDSSQQLELVLKLPKNITELRAVRETLLIYQKEHQQQVQINIIFLYIFLQAFMIPGSIFLNILAGSLYGFYEALILVLVRPLSLQYLASKHNLLIRVAFNWSLSFWF
jgi:hypothetical protein